MPKRDARERANDAGQGVLRCEPSPDAGLSDAQVAERVAAGMVNATQKGPSRSVGRIFRDNLFTLFNLINLILGILVLSVGSYLNATFLLIALANLAIGVVQEVRSKRVVEKLSVLTAPEVFVMRGGEKRKVRVEKLVLDDVQLLYVGNQVCADAVLLRGGVEVDESLLTGESDPVRKREGEELLSGSFIMSGSCAARTERVGADSYAARIAEQAKVHKKPKSELMNAMNGILRFASWVILPLGVLLLCKQLFLVRLPVEDAIVSTVAACIGMIPEGLILLTSVALAVGVIRLAQKRTLVQQLYSIETLARVDMLCLDKTGTLTKGSMRLEGVLPLAQNVDEPTLCTALAAVCAALPGDTNATMTALRAAVGGEATDWPVTQVCPFSSARKRSGASFGERGSYILGAPEFVLADAQAALREVQAAMLPFQEKGERVLLLGHSEGALDAQGNVEGVRPLGLLRLTDEMRENVGDTMDYFNAQGVHIKIISGDDPHTVSRIAAAARVRGADNYVDATTLPDAQAVANAAGRYTVFGRVTPEQKRELVHALQAGGHTVAMTGDGVNDVLALKDADCSVAMASGSDAARHVAQLVLLDNDFACMPAVVAEGRRVINNIHRAASLFLVKTIFSLLLSLVFLFLPRAYPFIPIQLSLISALAVGVPSFFLALEPNDERVRGHFLPSVVRRALPGALTIAVCIGVVLLLAAVLPLTQMQVGTLSTLLAGFASLWVLRGVCRPFVAWHAILWGTLTASFVVAVLAFGSIFSINAYDVALLPILLPMLAAIPAIMWGWGKLVDKLPMFRALDDVMENPGAWKRKWLTRNPRR